MTLPRLAPRVRTRLPLFDAWSLIHVDESGSAWMTRFIWTTAAKWRRMPQSSDSGWGVRRIGGFVMACRLEVFKGRQGPLIS